MAAVIFLSSALVLLFTYGGYPLLLLLLGLVLRKPVQKEQVFPFVSFIVVAHNEEACIAEKMKNTLELDYPAEKIERILALDGSTDRTETIARTQESAGITLLVHPERAGKYATQYKAVQKTCGEILVFSDANSTLDANAVEMLVRNFSDPAVGLVCGDLNYRSKDPLRPAGESVYKKYDNWLKTLESGIGSCVATEGALFAMRKELYLEPAPGVSEDLTLPMHVACQGKRVVYEKEAKAYEPFDLGDRAQVRRRARITHRNLRGFLAMRSLLNPLRYKLYAVELWFHKILVLFSPFFLIALFAANIVLADLHPGFQVFLRLQTLFYLLAFFHPLLKKLRATGPWTLFFALPYFLCLSHAGILLGFLEFLTGRPGDTWEPLRP